MKCGEELGELSEAVLSYESAPGCGYKGKTIDDVAEECADVVICIISALAKATNYQNEGKLAETMNIKIEKWIAKITENK
jgi:NTP pyrophosphatase (non-canonical NTP hydrolase)